MHGFRVLALDGHSAAAVECTQSLGRRGARIDVACEQDDCIAFHSRYLRRRLRQPPLVPLETATGWLYALYRKHHYDLVLPCTDAGLQLVRALPEDDPLRRRAAVAGDAALDVALDKEATRALAARLGVRTPATRLFPRGSTPPHYEAYPVVLKPVHSRVEVDGRNVRLEPVVARTAAERRRLLERWLPHTAVQEQQFVPGHGFGIEMLYEHGRLAWYFAHERLHEVPLTGGGSSYRRSIAPPAELLGAADALLSHLRWHGAVMVEFRGRSIEGATLMEINPRLWGSLALAIDCGVDFPRGLAHLAAGEKLPAQPAYRVGYHTRQVYRDATWLKLNMLADHGDALLLTRPRARSFAELLRPLAGRESWDHFDWRDPAVTLRALHTALAYEGGRLRDRLLRLRERMSALRRHRRLARRLAPGARVLFVCYGNICRSAAAAALGRSLGLACASVGFHGEEGRRTPQHVLRAASTLGIDLTEHASRRLRRADVEAADLIVCMDLDNLRALRTEYPGALARTTLLGLFTDRARLEIADPYARPEAEARELLGQLADAVRALRRLLPPLAGSRRPASCSA